jgi:hypothetical protein
MADAAVSIEHTAAATAEEAMRVLAGVFDEPGDYLLTGPNGLFGVRLSDAALKARDPLTLWHALFPFDGHYVIKKARPIDPREEPVVLPKRLPRWWLEGLLNDATEGSLKLRDVFLQRLDSIFMKHAGRLATPEAQEAIEEALFDFRLAIKWSLGYQLTPKQHQRLVDAGYKPEEILQFPGLSYRLGMIEAALDKEPGLDLAAILKIARATPLNPADEVAIQYATAKAAEALTPVLLHDPTVAIATALDRERSMVRTLTADAIRREWSTKEFSRQLRETLSPEGIVRDFDRVARTEMQDARVRGAFAADAKARKWSDATHVFRTIAAVPCNECLRLYKTPEGMPRLYTVEALHAADDDGYNRRRPYHARIGPTHPNCLCSPWVKWWPEMHAIYDSERSKWTAAMKRRGMT